MAGTPLRRSRSCIHTGATASSGSVTASAQPVMPIASSGSGVAAGSPTSAKLNVDGVPDATNCAWPPTTAPLTDSPIAPSPLHAPQPPPRLCRKPEVLADALLAGLVVPREQVHGKWLVDEDLLALAGVTDLEPYNCVPGGKPIRIGDEGSAAALWKS